MGRTRTDADATLSPSSPFPIDFALRKKRATCCRLAWPRPVSPFTPPPIRATPEKIAPSSSSPRPIHSTQPIKGTDEKLRFVVRRRCRRGDGMEAFTFWVRYCKVSLHNLPDLESIEPTRPSSLLPPPSLFPFLFFPPSLSPPRSKERDVPLSFSDELWPLICTPSVAKKPVSSGEKQGSHRASQPASQPAGRLP